MVSMLPWLAAGMAVLVSPDHLRLWGNLAGRAGSGFWWAVLGAAAVYALTALGYRRLARSVPGDGGCLSALRIQGGSVAVALLLASRLALTVGLSTGVLVTAGFVFNETFLYWFPNFGFAFLCLAVVVLVHLGGYDMAEKTQLILLVTAVAGLTLLTAIGFWHRPAQGAFGPATISGVGLSTLLSSLLLFVGFDLGIHRSEQGQGAGTVATTMLMVLGLTVIVLGLWGTVSLMFVAADRLAESFIPYTLAARGIGGQSGRILIGVVLIAGTLCAVSALVAAVGRTAASLAQLEMLPKWCRGSKRRNVFPTLAVAVAVAAMMAGGFAGTAKLERFIQAGFLLWLLNAAMVHLAVFRTDGFKASAAGRLRVRQAVWLHPAAAAVLSAAAACLIITDAKRLLVLGYLLTWWSGILVVLLFARLANRRSQALQKKQHPSATT